MLLILLLPIRYYAFHYYYYAIASLITISFAADAFAASLR